MTMLVDPQHFLQLCLQQEGKPYVWGSKGPVSFDCSGLVTWALWKASGPDWRATHNSQHLFDALEPAKFLSTGEVGLSFFGSTAATIHHVMVAVGDGRSFGAVGGDRTTTSIEAAKKQNAGVRYRPTVVYRAGFQGYRTLSLRAGEPEPDLKTPAA